MLMPQTPHKAHRIDLPPFHPLFLSQLFHVRGLETSVRITILVPVGGYQTTPIIQNLAQVRWKYVRWLLCARVEIALQMRSHMRTSSPSLWRHQSDRITPNSRGALNHTFSTPHTRFRDCCCQEQRQASQTRASLSKQ